MRTIPVRQAPMCCRRGIRTHRNWCVGRAVESLALRSSLVALWVCHQHMWPQMLDRRTVRHSTAAGWVRPESIPRYWYVIIITWPMSWAFIDQLNEQRET